MTDGMFDLLVYFAFGSLVLAVLLGLAQMVCQAIDPVGMIYRWIHRAKK